MGTNRRYAHYYDQQMDAQIIARWVAAAGPVHSLTKDELDLENEPLSPCRRRTACVEMGRKA